MLAKGKERLDLGKENFQEVENISIDFVVKSAAWFLLRRQVPFDFAIGCISYELSNKSPMDVLRNIPCEYRKEFLNLREMYKGDCEIFYEHFDLESEKCSELDYLTNELITRY